MDPSSAKSKRSFTQAHTKKSHHSNRKQEPSTSKDATSNSKKFPEKQSREKINLSTGESPSHDSNQGRFDDRFHSHSEVESCTPLNSVVHKSNGADYRLLISEAEEALPPISARLDPFAALDDFLPDFRQGLRSMLSVRGEGAFSLIKDDTFILDDEATMDPETPLLLSLNLPALAHHLHGVDLSKRLFMCPDAPLHYAELLAETPALATRTSHESREAGPPVRSEGSDSDGLSLRKSGGEDSDWEERMLGSEAEEAEAELDMLLNSSISMGSPPRPSNHGSSRATDADQVVRGDVISGFDAWLDTI